jgi:hypothetical protein
MRIAFPQVEERNFFGKNGLMMLDGRWSDLSNPSRRLALVSLPCNIPTWGEWTRLGLTPVVTFGLGGFSSEICSRGLLWRVAQAFSCQRCHDSGCRAPAFVAGAGTMLNLR